MFQQTFFSKTGAEEPDKEDIDEEENEDSVEKCSICFDCPSGKVGLLQNCDHVFCMACIGKWRSHSRGDDTPVDTKRSCPICRKKSFFVVPSSRPLKGKLRESAIESFKLVCSARPCKNFVRVVFVSLQETQCIDKPHARVEHRYHTRTATPGNRTDPANLDTIVSMHI